jgi:hypothetical protein
MIALTFPLTRNFESCANLHQDQFVAVEAAASLMRTGEEGSVLGVLTAQAARSAGSGEEMDENSG